MPRPWTKSIDIRDDVLRAEIVAAAVRAYHALGGTYEVASPAPAVKTNDAEMKLLHDIGMVDA